eukprot:GFKZ01013019.1.p1 GENE.GFKZ01013019.1~~GFKZ01013019.1.p1  ORF type:complete len:855 (-),score=119.58 GFKZ01013019.1:1482-4046(-)
MEISIRSLLSSPSIPTALTTATHLVTEQSSGAHPVLSISLWQRSADANSPSNPLAPHSEWHSADGHPFANLFALDQAAQRVYAVLGDRCRVVSFPFASSGGDVVLLEDPKHLEFQSPITALVRLPRCSTQQQQQQQQQQHHQQQKHEQQQQQQRSSDEGDFIFAFSEAGECALICVEAGTMRVLYAMSIIPEGQVLDAMAFDNDFVLVLAIVREKFSVYPLFLNRGLAPSPTSLKRLVPMRLPAPPQGAALSTRESKVSNLVLAFDFERDSGAVLYRDGTVHILHPSTTGVNISDDSFGLWRYAENNATGADRAASVKLAHSFQVSPDMPEGSECQSQAKHDWPSRGGLLRFGKSYIAVGYGHYVSLWDVRYFVGHGLIRVRGTVASLSAGRHNAAALLCTDNGVHEVFSQNADVFGPVTLGLAMTRKGLCEEIVTRIEPVADTAPIRSQPVTVSATRTAAEAGGRVERVFRSLMKAVDDAEQEIVGALLDREQAGTAEEVAQLTAEYTTANNGVRRGNLGEDVDTGLARLPSERLAAVSVARCLHELHRGNGKFLVPLIDMLGTGVVSNEAVMAVLGLSDSWEMGEESDRLNLLSIIDPLLSSHVYWNALEAVITQVSDLSEPDIVRVVQVVVRMTHREFEREMEAQLERVNRQREDENKEGSLLTRSTNLLVKCVMASAARGRLVESLKQVPVADAIAILSRLEQVLKCRSIQELKQKTWVPAVPDFVQLGFFHGNEFSDSDLEKYRGVGNWLDNDRDSVVATNSSDELQGCIAWIGHLIDAHLTNLVMDENGARLARKLLALVRKRRREYELLKSLLGVSWHLSEGKPLPRCEDPLYKPQIVRVPLFASLE